MKRIFALILVVAFVLALVGCEAPIKYKNKGDVKEDIIEQETTDVENEQEDTVDYTNLVTDYSSDEVVYADGDMECAASYNVPQINLDSAEVDAINQEIVENFGHLAEVSRNEVAEYGCMTTSGSLTYEWYVYEDILSLVIDNYAHPQATGCDDYWVYNVSISNKTEVTDDVILEVTGFTKEEYYLKAPVAMGHHYLNMCTDYEMMKEYNGFDECFYNTIDESNVEENKLFVNTFGELQAIANIYWIAGAGMYSEKINISNYDSNEHYEEFFS